MGENEELLDTGVPEAVAEEVEVQEAPLTYEEKLIEVLEAMRTSSPYGPDFDELYTTLLGVDRIEGLLAMEIKQVDFLANMLRQKIQQATVGAGGVSPLKAAIDIIAKLPSMPKPTEVFI